MQKFLSYSTLVGSILFIVGVWLARADFLSQIDLLMFLGIAVIAPLALVNLNFHSDERLYGVASLLQPVAAIGGGISLVMPISPVAGVFSLGWLLFTLCVAMLGLQRWLPRGRVPLNEFCLIAGMIYAPISGIWFTAYRTWGSFLGFDLIITALTAVHFCFISLGGLVIVGLLGRVVSGSWYRAAVIGAIVSPALVAVGITLTNALTTVSIVEVAGVVLLAASFLMLSAITVIAVPNKLNHPAGKSLLVVSTS